MSPPSLSFIIYSIAIELLSDPGLLFLDEPTSGLDSASALQVMQILRNLADNKGCALVATLHQPSHDLWQLTDSCMFLVKGKVVYFGNPFDKLLSFFELQGYPIPNHANVPDFVLSVINEDFKSFESGLKIAEVDHLVEAFNEMKREEANKVEASTNDDINATTGASVSGGGIVDNEEDYSVFKFTLHGYPHGSETIMSYDETMNEKHTRANFQTRFLILCERNFKELIRDPGILNQLFSNQLF